MPKVCKVGWSYIYSETLQMEIAIHNKTGWVYCADGVKYSPIEIRLIERQNGCLTIEEHLLKKTFGGEVVETKQYEYGRPGQGKYPARTKTNDTDSNKIERGNIPEDSGPLRTEGDRQLDIF